jgi:hypothetical protein
VYKIQKAYLLKDRPSVVFNKPREEFEEVNVCISMLLIKEWAEEIEMMGLDEEEEF